MRRGRTILSLMLATLMVISMIAFSPAAAQDTNTEEKPKTIKVGMFEQPDSLNPVLASTVSAWEFLNWLYDPLVRWDDD
ncbi:MAG: hypothetical protein ACTSVT_11015, partial [Candidatus Thorarchaeota archaeon]